MAKIGELRDLGFEDLRLREKDLVDQLFRARIQKSIGGTDTPGRLRALRRELARVKTLIRQKELAGGRQPAAGSKTS